MNNAIVKIYRNFKIILFLLIITCNINAIKNNDFSDLTILVNSCDYYEELWEPFFKILFSKWKSLEKSSIPIVLITTGKNFSHNKVTVFKNQNELSWSETVSKALQSIKTKYVLYLQEDYFFTNIDVEKLATLFKIMKKNDMGYMQLFLATSEQRNPVLGVKDLFYKNKFERWRTALQAAFWRKDTFLYLLKPEERIWDFEITGSIRSEGNTSLFTTVTDHYPLEYLNMAAEGNLNDDNLKKVKNLYGLEWKTTLPLNSTFTWRKFFKRKIEAPLYYNFWVPFKNLCKRLLK